MKPVLCIICIFIFCSFGTAVHADDTAERLKKLEDTVQEQSKTIEEQQRSIDALTRNAEQQENQDGTKQAKGASSPKASGLFGGSAFTNPNISLILDTFAYASNLGNDELANRGIPGFTTQGLDQRKGFNLDSAELFLFSPVDPYFNLYANLPVTEDGIELEEAYVVTTALPEGWQIKGGKFKSNFSRLNAQHPHAWDFWDIALPYRAFLGSEGLGGEKGVQLTYLPAWSIYTQIGVEVLQGENDLLFGQDAQEGPHAYSFFVKSSFDTSDNSTIYFGPSVLFGKTRNTHIVPSIDPTQTAEFMGKSVLYGLEMVWKWKPTSQEGLTLQSEYLFLSQTGDVTDPAIPSVDALQRRQDGFYVQGIYRKNRWRVGVRYDVLDLFSDTFTRGGVEQNFGGTPHRTTGSVEFNPSEFTRIRLQLAHDLSDPSGRTNNEAILQFNFGIGAHAAHAF
jgi:hypothetical protein